MNKRLQVVGAGAAMAAMLGVGTLTGHGAFAQSATPSATATAPSTATDKATARKAAYDAFVAKLATQLGISDPAKVDTAIKAVMKQQVDDMFAAGDISANEATAIKARIDAGDAGPLGFGLGRGMGMGHGKGGRHGGMNDQGDGNGNGKGGNDATDNGSQDNGGSDTETPDGTPAATT